MKKMMSLVLVVVLAFSASLFAASTKKASVVAPVTKAVAVAPVTKAVSVVQQQERFMKIC